MSASKWPRVKWNQENARLANAPFENLFSEQENKMSALDDLIEHHKMHHANLEVGPYGEESQRAELAQLRADLQAAQERVAEQARQLTEARKALHDYELPEDTISFAMRELACIIPADEMLWHTWLLRQADIIDAWLAANPAPQDTPLTACGKDSGCQVWKK